MEKSEQAYYHEEPEVAAWALKDYISMANEYSSNQFVEPVDTEYYVLLSHARLARIYKQLGQREKREKHLTQALEYSGEYAPKSVSNQQSLSSWLDMADDKFRSLGEAIYEGEQKGDGVRSQPSKK
ncbi:MAG: hypothetical protein R6V03_00370 [Kiritimatiellia bacterium]